MIQTNSLWFHGYLFLYYIGFQIHETGPQNRFMKRVFQKNPFSFLEKKSKKNNISFSLFNHSNVKFDKISIFVLKNLIRVIFTEKWAFLQFRPPFCRDPPFAGYWDLKKYRSKKKYACKYSHDRFKKFFLLRPRKSIFMHFYFDPAAHLASGL
jgi:hypothetical protein